MFYFSLSNRVPGQMKLVGGRNAQEINLLVQIRMPSNCCLAALLAYNSLKNLVNELKQETFFQF